MTQKQIFDLPIGPGVYTEQTERGAVGQWKTADKVRFRKGLPEKIGGWVRLEPQFLGLARRLKDWTSLDGRTWTAIGTDKKLYLWQDQTLYDITPLRDSGTLTAPFDTSVGTSIVTVNHVNHGAQVGDYVRFSNAIAGGGITVDGEYTVASVIDQDSYTIVDDETATSTATGTGGTPDYEYDISVGVESVISATGWGAGGYGTDRTGYNTPLVSGFNALLVPIRTWTLDNWGEDLLACPRGGKIYWWDRTEGATGRAVALGGDAPPTNEGVIISQRDRHVISLGAYDYFNEATDPLLIRWSSTEDLNDWIPTSTNTSGDLRLYSGSKIVTGVRSRLELVIFTDVSVHTLPFVGGFDVFGLNIVGENVSILGPNCAIAVDSRVFFMAEADFYLYDGIVRVLPCNVRNFVYQNLNVQQKDKIYGGLNREFNEVWWFYPSYDPETWVQDTFELGLPPGYSLANASEGGFAGTVVFQADWDGVDEATSYTEQSSNARSIIFDLGSLQSERARFGTTSVHGGSFEGWVESPYIAAYELGSLDWSIESWINLRQLPTDNEGQEWTIINQWGGALGDAWAINFVRKAGVFNMRVRLGGTIIDVPVTNTSVVSDFNAPGTWYHVVVERIGGTVYVGFNGFVEGSGAFAGSVPASTNNIKLIDNGDFEWSSFMWVDDTRVSTGGSQYNLNSGSTYTVPTTTLPAPGAGGGSGNIGYVYNFNSGGYTERVPSADNNYEHDYFLTNADPILTPMQSEYAVEIDVNPDHAGTGSAGLLFLRTDATGDPNTDADDCYQWMVELDYTNDLVRILKKEAAAPAAPDNLGGNTVDFTTLTGSAMATGQKYIITVQFDTPTITVWVDGNQAFQFDMSVAELAQFTSGTAGLHAAPDTVGDQYRFYNFASGPVGTVSAADFDISPIEVNRYVAFNYEEGTWTIGKLARTAWADRSPQLERAYAAGLDGYLYQHETGTDDNGAAMTAYIESYDMEIPQAGEELMHVDQLIPDFLELEGTVNLYLTGRKYPQDPNRISKGPYPVQAGVRKLSTRIRARQVALRVESTTTGDRWRMGTIRGRAGPHGKRG